MRRLRAAPFIAVRTRRASVAAAGPTPCTSLSCRQRREWAALRDRGRPLHVPPVPVLAADRSWTPWGFAESLEGWRHASRRSRCTRLRRSCWRPLRAPRVLCSRGAPSTSCMRTGSCRTGRSECWPLGRRSIPLVVSLHGSDVAVSERSRAIGRTTRWSLARASAVTAPSGDLLERAKPLGARGLVERVPVPGGRGGVRRFHGCSGVAPVVASASRGARTRRGSRTAHPGEGLRVPHRGSRRGSRRGAAAPPPARRRRRRSPKRSRGAGAHAGCLGHRRLRRDRRSRRGAGVPRRGGHRCRAVDSLRGLRRRPAERRTRGDGRWSATRRVGRRRRCRTHRACRRERPPRLRAGLRRTGRGARHARRRPGSPRTTRRERSGGDQGGAKLGCRGAAVRRRLRARARDSLRRRASRATRPTPRGARRTSRRASRSRATPR